MPTNKQRRQAAQRHLQRQLERRAAQARRRRRNMGIVATVVAVLVVVGAALLIAGVGGGGSKQHTAAAGATTAAGSCTWSKATGNSATLKDVGTPPTTVPTTGTTELTMNTNFGAIGLTLNRKKAPCASASMVYLAQKKFFDNTPCHRETSSPQLKVLQCGDPSGTGTGGPSYQFPTHVTGKETYQRGTLAMANSGQGYDGSQFFLVYGDSQLPAKYTVVGTIDDAGLKVLDTIAANGNNGANGKDDGAPTKPVTITSMTVDRSAASAPPAATTAP